MLSVISRSALLPAFVLIHVVATQGCALFPERIPVKSGSQGAVHLERTSEPFMATHPAVLSPDLLEKIFAGLRIGIQPSDRIRHSEGIAPINVFSPQQVAFLSESVSTALQEAETDHVVTFHVGPEAERTDGQLFVRASTLHISLSHYRSPAGRPDENLSLYALSIIPEQAQAPTAPSNRARAGNRPQIAIAYDKMAPAPAPPSSPSVSRALPDQPVSKEPAPESEEVLRLREVVDSQAAELKTLKAELETLRKHMADQQAKTKPKQRPLPKPGNP